VLPKGVRPQNGRYYLVRRVAGVVKWIPLTRQDEGVAALNAKLAEQDQPAVPRTVGELLNAFLADESTEIRSITRLEYRRNANARLIPTFGHMPIGALTSQMVASYLERGRKAGRPTMANRERACLSSAYAWGMRNEFATSNPCHGVRQNKERKSRAEVSDAQFIDGYRRSPQYVRNLLYVAYLTGLRFSDLRQLRKGWVTPAGIQLDESKTGKRDLILWTPFLRLAIDRALEYASEWESNDFVLVTAWGHQWNKSSLESAMRRYKLGFAFRLIRVKAATDGDTEGNNVLGHGGQMLRRYVRRQRLRPVA
jgi:integrase